MAGKAARSLLWHKLRTSGVLFPSTRKRGKEHDARQAGLKKEYEEAEKGPEETHKYFENLFSSTAQKFKEQDARRSGLKKEYEEAEKGLEESKKTLEETRKYFENLFSSTAQKNKEQKKALRWAA